VAEISVIGYFSEIIVLKLNLNISPGTEIFLSESTLSHIRKSHKEDYDLFSNFIADIIKFPNYVRFIPDSEVRFLKIIDSDYVCVPVRQAGDGCFYLRSLFRLHKKNVERFIRQGLFVGLTGE
jgi:hypothetical protein